MATNWHSFEPTQFFPEPLQRAVSAIDTAFGALTKATGVVEKALRIAATLARTASTNPVETALRTAVSEIDKYVEGLLGNTQCHAILIPIRKQVVRRSPASASRLNDFLTPGEPGATFVENALVGKAGTGVFFRTLIESVGDAGDINRPDFPSDYAVVGACVLAGAESLNDLQVPFRLFSNLFVGNQRIAPSANTLPVVQNLRVTPAALRGGTGVVLRWDALAPVTNVPLFSDDNIIAKEIFVIRTSLPFQRGFFSWGDLFNDVEPSDSPSDLPVKDQSRVIARLRNHGAVVGYTDSQNLLDPKKTYYYTTCVRYTVNNVVQPMGPLGNVVRVTRTNPAPSTRQATPPDWIASPTLMQMFPPLNEVINQVRLGVSRLGNFTSSNTGPQQLLTQTIDQIQRLIAQWSATVDQANAATDRLQALTAGGTPSGMYSTVISKNTGGMDGWLAELARRLGDTTDTSRPQLSDDAMVVGFIMVAGAPRLPDLSAIKALLELFFGKHPKNPLFDTIRALDGVPGRAVTSPTASAPILGYDDALNPSTTPTC